MPALVIRLTTIWRGVSHFLHGILVLRYFFYYNVHVSTRWYRCTVVISPVFGRVVSQNSPTVIVRFDTWNIVVQLVDPVSSGRAVMPAVQKADNQPSSRSESRITDQRSAFSDQNPSIETPYKIARKQPNVSIAQFPQVFWKFSACSSQLSPSSVQNTCLTMLYHNILWGKFSRLFPVDSNLEHHTRSTARHVPVLNLVQLCTLYILQ